MESQKPRKKSEILFVYPWGNPFRRISGGDSRASGMINLILECFKDVKVRLVTLAKLFRGSNMPKNIEIVKIPGKGGMFLDLNLVYYLKLVNIGKSSNAHYIVISSPLGIFGALFSKLLLSLKVIYDSHNVEYERVNSKAFSNPNRIVQFLTKLVLLTSERLAIKYSDYTIAISNRDKKIFKVLYNVPLEKIKVIYPEISTYGRYYKRRKIGVLFHGNFKYIPNKEAVEILLRISKSAKWVHFYVAGSGISKDKIGNLEFLGFVDNLDDFLAKGDIALIPLKRGAGVKIKIVDYLMRGIPIITTDIGAQGLELTNWKNVVIVNTEIDCIKALETLMTNPKFKRKIGFLGFRHAQKLFSKKKIKRNLVVNLFRNIDAKEE